VKALRTAQCSLPLLLATICLPASASRWVPVVEGPTRAIYLDLAGLVRDGQQVRTWVREVYTEEQRSEQVGVLYYSANSLVSYDCARRTWAPLFRAFYSGDGTELRRVNLDAVEPSALAAPGSVQESLLERACAPARQAKADAKAKATPGPAETGIASAGAAEAGSGHAATAAKPPAPAEKPAGPTSAAKSEPAQVARPDADAERAAKAAPGAAPVKAGIETVNGVDAHAGTPARPRRVSRPRVREPAAHAVVYEPRSRRAALGAQPADLASAEVHWSYGGPGGPEQWGKLKPEYEACAKGQRQSPIDIKDGARLELQPIVFDYKPAPLRIVDNGHTVQVNYAEGSTITVAGERYELKQFHFHKPAEERIDGRSFDMVAHLVHRSLDGRLAVVAVLFEAREQSHPILRALWPYLPLEAGRESAPKDVVVDANALLPEVRTYFTYIGSLTTPPCSEGVLWLVLKTPMEVAPEQVAVFGKLYSMNARPLQPAHGRLIKESN
jgi:carbonic anhydrase